MKGKNRSMRLSHLAGDPVLLFFVVLVFSGLALFVVLPLSRIFVYGVTDDAGKLDFAAAIEMLGSGAYASTFRNSMMLGIVTAVIATLIGYAFAYAITRTDLPFKGFFKAVATIPIISPPFVLSLSMIFLFGRNGLITRRLFGIEDANVYGMRSLVIIQSISFFPIAYLTLTGILEKMNPAVEDAALNLGASKFRIFRTVTLPLSLPGIVSALLLVFIQSMEDFSNPAVISGNFSTLAVEAYRIITGMYDMRGGSLMALMLLAPTFAAFALQKYWLSGKSFVTVTGKPGQVRVRAEGPALKWTLFAFCALIAFIVILFYGTVLVGAFVKIWGINFTLTWSHFKYVFSVGWAPLRNSVTLALIATPITGILGMIIAFLVVRKSFPGKRLMEFLSMLTFAVPGTVVGISYILAFNQKPFLLTGTAFILVMVFTFRNMPVGIEAGTSTLLQIDMSIEEASTILGATSAVTFRRISLPLLRQAFFSGLVYSFVRSMTAVSAVIFLISPRWNLATAGIFSLFEASKYSDAAAYIVVMIAIILVAMAILNFLVNLLGKSERSV
ncbi:MAG: ABC transporter permease [Treponema sp. GWB1_62_6]|nr:MAG: ABC transporter permease [Treponema sp. GWA1_62_8]OHE67352.1 MAG: ABC transporter permease [Treponema sp. GWB1_62_6]OHE67506.1 MAG: ABC transporter permease [Treponema sp. GWC1_61_84]OHE75135.1 MAG: ABC transporter permease [Treponema sp. RIFOXYC1_FULL_61_9]HCM26069.1 ABC transporter permease [Treponema sp.]